MYLFLFLFFLWGIEADSLLLCGSIWYISLLFHYVISAFCCAGDARWHVFSWELQNSWQHPCLRILPRKSRAATTLLYFQAPLLQLILHDLGLSDCWPHCPYPICWALGLCLSKWGFWLCTFSTFDEAEYKGGHDCVNIGGCDPSSLWCVPNIKLILLYFPTQLPLL